MVDLAVNYPSSKEMPGYQHYVITPSSSLLDPLPRALRVNDSVDGTVTIEDADGTSIVWNVVAYEIIPFRAAKVTAATVALIAIL